MRQRLRGQVKKTTLEFRVELYEAASALAQERRMPLVTWIENAITSQVNRESRYEEKGKKRKLKRKGEGMICTFCECPATECKKPELHSQLNQFGEMLWWEEDKGQLG